MAYVDLYVRTKTGSQMLGTFTESDFKILKPYSVSMSEGKIVLRGIWSLEEVCRLGVHVVLSDRFEQQDSRGYPGRLFLQGYLEPSRPRKRRQRAMWSNSRMVVETSPHVPGEPMMVRCSIHLPGSDELRWDKGYADLPVTDAVLIHLYRTLLWVKKDGRLIPDDFCWVIDDYLLSLVLAQEIWPNSSLNERRRKRLMNLWGKLSSRKPSVVYSGDCEKDNF